MGRDALHVMLIKSLCSVLRFVTHTEVYIEHADIFTSFAMIVRVNLKLNDYSEVPTQSMGFWMQSLFISKSLNRLLNPFVEQHSFTQKSNQCCVMLGG